MSNPTITATVGLPGSGKTTWADQQVAVDITGTLVVVNRDHIRRMLRKPYPADERLVTHIQHASIRAALAMNRSVISDDTNLNPDHLHALRFIARDHGAGFRVNTQFLQVPLDEVIRRNSQRPKLERVSDNTIRALAMRWADQWPQLQAALQAVQPLGQSTERNAVSEEDIGWEEKNRRAAEQEKENERKAKEANQPKESE